MNWSARLVHLVGVERTEALWPPDPARPLDPAPGLDLAGIDLGALGQAYGDVSYRRLEGSNNWVVSAARTATGKPLLANDPHRAIGVPSLRYVMHLVGPGWNVIVEEVGPCGADGQRCYRTRGVWIPMRVVVDTIRVRGERPRVVRLEYTEHGPILAEDRARGRAFVVRFVGSEPGTAGYLAQLSIDRARDWPSFLEAAARWKLPTENLVYADVDGHIGWNAAGLMPVRGWSGLLPVPGDGRYEWQGMLPPRELPQAYDPPSGMIVTANHNILPPGYPHALNYDWAPPYRAQRIDQV